MPMHLYRFWLSTFERNSVSVRSHLVQAYSALDAIALVEKVVCPTGTLLMQKDGECREQHSTVKDMQCLDDHNGYAAELPAWVHDQLDRRGHAPLEGTD